MIEISNKIKCRLAAGFVRGVAQDFFKRMKLAQKTAVSIVFATDAQMRRLNWQYKQKNQTTDVLAFSNLEGGKVLLPDNFAPYLGEIIINYPQAKRQARIWRHSVRAELKLLLIHGLLHLLKYDDEGEKEREKMMKLQEKMVREIKT